MGQYVVGVGGALAVIVVTEPIWLQKREQKGRCIRIRVMDRLTRPIMASLHAQHWAAPPSTGYRLYSLLMQFPVVCFTLALLTDITYWQTSNLMWTEFSAWLLLAGISLGTVAMLVRLFDLVIDRSERRGSAAWLHFFGLVVILVLAFFNNLIHARDGWTSVVPWGLTLSALTVLAIAITGWAGRSLLQTGTADANDHV